MMNKIGLICALSMSLGLVVGSGLPANAAKPVAIEKELLGVRVLQNYREVLVRYGAPTRVFRATETVNYNEAVDLSGAPTGGILGALDASSRGGAGGPGGPMMGGGPGGPMMGQMMGMMGGGRPGGTMGPGAPQGAGGYPGMGNPGGGQGGGDGTFGESGGFTWVYLYPFKELAYEFHFNKDGRIERIAELGRGFGQHTSRGIGLGDTLDKIYSIYGWTDRIIDEGNGKFSLLYNDRYHAQFLILKNKVVGISVFLKENQYLQFNGSTGGGAAGPAGMGGRGPMMGGPMMGGMSGGPRMGGKRGGGKMDGGGA